MWSSNLVLLFKNCLVQALLLCKGKAKPSMPIDFRRQHSTRLTCSSFVHVT